MKYISLGMSSKGIFYVDEALPDIQGQQVNGQTFINTFQHSDDYWISYR